MKIWLSLFFITSTCWALCDFRSDVNSIYSLSGPFTTGLQAIGLHQSLKLRGISSFYETGGEKFHGEKIPGGSLLSPVTVRNFHDGIIFFDESLETEKILKAFGENLRIKKMITRNLSPMEVTKLVVKELETVTKGCQTQLAAFETSVKEIQKEILHKIPQNFMGVFFLGGFEGVSTPDLVMANDGFVKWLKEEKKISTYPTDLAYVPWSAKILNDKMRNSILVGLVDSNKSEILKHGEKKYTCKFPRALTPGVDQLKALKFFLTQL
jgi:hypothetical protein